MKNLLFLLLFAFSVYGQQVDHTHRIRGIDFYGSAKDTIDARGNALIGDSLDALRSNVTLDTLAYGISYHDDLRFPAAGINPPGGASDPTRETTYGTLVFSASATNIIAIQAQLPHSYKEGTDLEPHVHWSKTTSAAGSVACEFKYRWASIGEVMDAAWTADTVYTPTVSDDNTAEKHALSAFATIDGTGRQISDMLIITVSRLGGLAADDYAAVARMLEVDIHYEVDSPGSRQEYIK